MGKHFRFLPVPVTDAEIAELARREVDLWEEQERADEAFAQSKAAHKATRERVDGELQEVRRGIRKQSVEREVECREELDLARQCVRIVRCDTGEEVTTRAIEDEDRQGKLDLAPRGPEWHGYPDAWPACVARCGKPVLDGKLTCGDEACNEAADKAAAEREKREELAKEADAVAAEAKPAAAAPGVPEEMHGRPWKYLREIEERFLGDETPVTRHMVYTDGPGAVCAFEAATQEEGERFVREHNAELDRAEAVAEAAERAAGAASVDPLEAVAAGYTADPEEPPPEDYEPPKRSSKRKR